MSSYSWSPIVSGEGERGAMVARAECLKLTVLSERAAGARPPSPSHVWYMVLGGLSCKVVRQP